MDASIWVGKQMIERRPAKQFWLIVSVRLTSTGLQMIVTG